MTVRKIRITDSDELRRELDLLYEQIDQMSLNCWALSLAERMLSMIDVTTDDFPEISLGFAVCQAWREGKARVHDIRQAGFAVHRLAKDELNPIRKAVFRTVGQAIGSGHMKEHAMVASDYAIKAIELQFPQQFEKIEEERRWQITSLALLVKK